jgi:hypothetical protein
MLAALRELLGRVFRSRRQPVDAPAAPDPASGGEPAGEAVPPAMDAAADVDYSSFLSWAIAQGAMTEEEAGEQMRQFEAEQRAKAGLSDAPAKPPGSS